MPQAAEAHALEAAHDFARGVIEQEENVLAAHDVKGRLIAATSTLDGLKRFAEAFYFIRYDFCRLNFIVGSRSPCDEFYWGGLAKNLYEELGGEYGVSHNQLYRDFLAEIGLEEEGLKEPGFATTFNKDWEEYCRNAPFMEALAALGIYEIYDNPDYQMLWDVAKGTGISKSGQLFFKVHAGVEHFEMFESLVSSMLDDRQNSDLLNSATGFVSATQSRMWDDLCSYCEARK